MSAWEWGRGAAFPPLHVLADASVRKWALSPCAEAPCERGEASGGGLWNPETIKLSYFLGVRAK